MQKWIDHMIRECMGEKENAHLIVRERKGGWCLGDWCTLEKTVIAEPFVNTYLFIKALDRYKELCLACGKEFTYDEVRRDCLAAIRAKYGDKSKKSCQMGIQGGDFFLADLGLLSPDEIGRAVAEYDKEGRFDVGIIGIEVLLDYLFTHGYEATGTKLLCSEKVGSFGYMKNSGATTLWEYWDGKKSQDHPMFGSAVKYLFYGVAGIRYDVGFRKVVLKPALYAGLNYIKCSLVRPNVTVEVEYKREGDKENYRMLYTGNSEVVAEWQGKTYVLSPGEELVFEK